MILNISGEEIALPTPDCDLLGCITQRSHTVIFIAVMFFECKHIEKLLESCKL